jgi:hypothetical protein
LSRANPGLPASRDATFAFWINAYNALTLAGILRVYPTVSIRDHTGRVFGFNIWKHLRLYVGGQAVSLSGIEHRILREWNDPRIHFGLVCAANACPALPQTAFTAESVDEQLDARARAFLTRPDALRFDSRRQVLSLSRLFQWYGSDFAPTSPELLACLRRYLPPDAALPWDADTRVEYLPCDWTLNDQTR